MPGMMHRWPHGHRWQQRLGKDDADQPLDARPGSLAAELRLCGLKLATKLPGEPVLAPTVGIHQNISDEGAFDLGCPDPDIG
jgi:hypothetical protein